MPGDALEPVPDDGWRPAPSPPRKPSTGAALWVVVGLVAGGTVAGFLLMVGASPFALAEAVAGTDSDRGCPNAGTGVFGEVRDHRGDPIDGAVVTVRALSTDPSSWNGRSHEDGCYAIATRPGSWRVCAEAPNYPRSCRDGVGVNPGDPTRLDFRLYN